MQKEFILFDVDEELPPSLEERREFLDVFNPISPYYGFIGNQSAIKKLIRLDIVALGRFNHCSSDINIALIGKAGCGKTDLAKRHGRANRLPFVELFPKAIKTVQDIFDEIRRVCEKNGLELYEENGEYVLPPINVFIDEVHALSNNLVQALLKATEQKDRVLVTENGEIIDCSLVHWIIATTDRGKLFDAFDTRFMKIEVNLYSKEEISQIINVNYPEWTVAFCDKVAFYCSSVPREALAFAKEVELELKTRDDVGDWDKVVDEVARENGIDKWGMTYKRVKILQLLSKGPISAKKLPVMIGVKIEELEKYILPPLLEGDNAFVSVSRKGYYITKYGVQELSKRNED